MIIYKITNKITKEIYIGQTVNALKTRWSQHCAKSSNCPKLYNAINKYNPENFTIEIIDICNNIEELNKKEIYWISKLDAINKGYNLIPGGHTTRGYKHIEESRNKMSTYRKGKTYKQIYGQETAKKLIKKKSEQNSGKNNINYGKVGKLNHRYGKSMHEDMLKILEKNREIQKKKVLCINTGVIYPSLRECSNALNIHQGNLWKVLNNKRKSTGGLNFQYLAEK
jgi:group I intron endonuclease